CLETWKKKTQAFLDFGDNVAPGLGLTFDVFNRSRSELRGFILGMFKMLGALDFLGVSPSAMLDFVCDVEGFYLPNPYHNFLHGVDVLFMVFYMLHHMEARRLLEACEIAGVAIASLCHDVGHPGLNNLYQVNAGTQLARVFSDSILECNSIALTMTLMEKHNLLANLLDGAGVRPGANETAAGPKESARWAALRNETAAEEVRRVVYDVIIATDMQYHFELMERFVNVTESIRSDRGKYESRRSGASPESPSKSSPLLPRGSRPSVNTGGRPAENETTPSHGTPRTSPRPSPPLTMVTKASQPLEDLQYPGGSAVDSVGGNMDGKAADGFHAPFSVPSPISSDVTSAALSPLAIGEPFSPTTPIRVTESSDSYGLSPAPPISILGDSGYLIPRGLPQPQAAPDGSWPSAAREASLSAEKLYPHTRLPRVSLTREQRQTLSEVLVHAADISNIARPWPVCKRWSDAIVEEFRFQEEMEKKSNLPLSHQREDHDHPDQTHVSLQFSDVLARPFFLVLADFMPEGNLFLEALASNRAHWHSQDSPGRTPPPAFPASPAAAGASKAKTAAEQTHAQTPLDSRSPPGRRVSVAAGTVHIPPNFFERLKRPPRDGRHVTRSPSGGGMREQRRGFREYLAAPGEHAESAPVVGIGETRIFSTSPSRAGNERRSSVPTTGSIPDNLNVQRRARRYSWRKSAASLLTPHTAGSAGHHGNLLRKRRVSVDSALVSRPTGVRPEDLTTLDETGTTDRSGPRTRGSSASVSPSASPDPVAATPDGPSAR
ncbi:MAG: hypothetical protein BJ554DRAFT_8381, partial [Olpidium bornovanus]